MTCLILLNIFSLFGFEKKNRLKDNVWEISECKTFPKLYNITFT